MTKRFSLKIKATLDRFLSAFLVLLLAPLLAVISLAVKVDGGPIFFTQERLGRNGKVFKIYKFRTMVVDADRFINSAGQPTYNRITVVGGFLRRTALDELPQIFNILRGEMSFIGPRPVLVNFRYRLDEVQKKRFGMRPGITGLAQVSGRNSIKWSKRIAYDVWYIENFSLWLDCQILFKTVWVIFSGKGQVMDRNPIEMDDLMPRRTVGDD